MKNDPTHSPERVSFAPERPLASAERSAFTALLVLLAAPVIAQGLWRPLTHVLGPAGSSDVVTGSALAIASAIAIGHRLRPSHTSLPSLALGCAVALGASAGLSLGLTGLMTLLGVAATVAPLVCRLPAKLPAALDGLFRLRRGLSALYVVVALLAVVSTTRLSVFMGDPTRVELQAIPGAEFISTHSCLTAYVHAATLSREGVDNLYAERWWHGAHGLPPRAAGAENPYDPFLLDYYAYPPPFLLMMAPLGPLDGDFPAQRALWFGLNALLLGIGLWLTSRWLDGPHASRTLVLAPLFFGSLPILVTLQIGNFQIAVVVLAVLAMVAFDRDRHALGGALLAFTILAKISPGLLGVYLLVQRRWRSAAWTAGFGVFFLALSLLTEGVNPLVSFLSPTLARISSGETFKFLDDTVFNIVTNMAPFGLPFKLGLMGIEIDDPWSVAGPIGRVYTVALLILTVIAARRNRDRRGQALTWLSLLVLAALQSPFAPGYVTIGLLWAVTLLAVEVRRPRGGVALVLLWLGLTVVLPTGDERLLAVYSVLQSLLTIGVSIWLVTRRPPHTESMPSDARPPAEVGGPGPSAIQQPAGLLARLV